LEDYLLKKYDVAVVGAGPAGSSAAFILAKAGMSVALIDKYEFPRNKLCGGGLTGRSKKIFDEIFECSWGEIIEKVSYGFAFFYRDKLLQTVDNYRPIYFTSRKKFDHFLIGLAVKEGAETLFGKLVKAVDLDDTKVIFADNGSIEAKYIIGADGVTSRVVKSAGLKSFRKNRLGFGLQIELPKDDIDRTIKLPEQYFGVVNWGYGWVFPKLDSYTVGIGGLLIKNVRIKEKFYDFLNMTCGSIPDVPIRGHYFPFGAVLNKPGKKNLLIVGDAAGLVEPITGEGISFAMLSGKFAGEAILSAHSTKKPEMAYAIYKRKYVYFERIFPKVRLMRYLFYPKIFLLPSTKIFAVSENIIKKQQDLVADEITYKRYYIFIIKYLWIAVFKSLLKSVFTSCRRWSH
jgi:geranylgeranyl reductase family protein